MKLIVQTMLLAVAVFAAGLWAAPRKIVVPANAPSIQKGLDEADEGDTVYVSNGTYKESIVMKDNVSLVGQDVEKTIIRGNGSKPVVEGANRSVIRNFTIEHGSTGIICKKKPQGVLGQKVFIDRNPLMRKWHHTGKFKAESLVEKVSVLKSVRINDEFNPVSIAFKVHTWSFNQTCFGKQG